MRRNDFASVVRSVTLRQQFLELGPMGLQRLCFGIATAIGGGAGIAQVQPISFNGPVNGQPLTYQDTRSPRPEGAERGQMTLTLFGV